MITFSVNQLQNFTFNIRAFIERFRSLIEVLKLAALQLGKTVIENRLDELKQDIKPDISPLPLEEGGEGALSPVDVLSEKILPVLKGYKYSIAQKALDSAKLKIDFISTVGSW